MPIWGGNSLFSKNLPLMCVTHTAQINKCRVCFPNSKCGDSSGDGGYESSPASVTPTLRPGKGVCVLITPALAELKLGRTNILASTFIPTAILVCARHLIRT